MSASRKMFKNPKVEALYRAGNALAWLRTKEQRERGVYDVAASVVAELCLVLTSGAPDREILRTVKAAEHLLANARIVAQFRALEEGEKSARRDHADA